METGQHGPRAGLMLWLSLMGCAAVAAVSPGVPWPATDGLGRSLPLAIESGAVRQDRFIGIFYFLCHNEPGVKSPHWDGPYDIAKILARDPGALTNSASPLWGKIGVFHYWGEPLYGYYRSNDPWVLRRHAWLLGDAGVDTLIFDTTNARTYPDVYLRLCQVFQEVRAAGGVTPQIAFMVNSEAGKTARELFQTLYRPGLFRDLWFQWKGKPLLICDPAAADPELKSFFTLRRAHWPFTLTNTPKAWHWEATYPQPYGYADDPDQPEQVNVSVAQNLRVSDGQVVNMSSGEARGRSFHDGRMDRSPNAILWGHNFQEQWRRPFELQPPFVMVTGWNEWTAGRWGKHDGPLIFVDQMDQEYSRDIEPMKGGHGDNYYYQFVANVRRWKGVPPLPQTSPPVSIRVPGGFAAWEAVRPEFKDHEGENVPREFVGVGGLSYTNRTGCSDFAVLKVARDMQNIYFYARTRDSLSSEGLPGAMWLLIDADQNAATGWQGYDFMLNHAEDDEGGPWLRRNAGGWHWNKVSRVSVEAEGKELHLAIPRRALGLRRGPVKIDFKWTDSLQQPGELMDFYLSGDVAPEGRFNYRYNADP